MHLMHKITLALMSVTALSAANPIACSSSYSESVKLCDVQSTVNWNYDPAGPQYLISNAQTIGYGASFSFFSSLDSSVGTSTDPFPSTNALGISMSEITRQWSGQSKILCFQISSFTISHEWNIIKNSATCFPRLLTW